MLDELELDEVETLDELLELELIELELELEVETELLLELVLIELEDELEVLTLEVEDEELELDDEVVVRVMSVSDCLKANSDIRIFPLSRPRLTRFDRPDIPLSSDRMVKLFLNHQRVRH